MLAHSLIIASAAVIGLLGLLHLVITFRGRRLWPRDHALVDRLRGEPLVLTRQTTFWRAWLGFNASHSLGAIFFGLIYGYLACCLTGVLLGSTFLLGLGQAVLLSYLVLAARYWFRIPLTGIAIANVLFAAGWIVSRLG